jgi:DNA-binding transcriptional ArsR family regulator
MKPPAQRALSLARVLHALSDPVRLGIARLAADGELACNQFGLDLPKATLSHHFKVLRQAGIINVRCQGTRHMTSLNRKELDRQFPGLMKAVLAAPRERSR